MKLPRRNFLHLAGGATLLPTSSRFASAQGYPSRPVRILVGFAAGGASDIVARLLAQQLSERFGQTFFVENRTGAGTNIATEAAVRAAPDGHTLLLATHTNAINATLYAKLPFNFLADWTPIAGIARVPNVMEVHPSVPAKTMAEFIALANPDTAGSMTVVPARRRNFRRGSFMRPLRQAGGRPSPALCSCDGRSPPRMSRLRRAPVGDKRFKKNARAAAHP